MAKTEKQKTFEQISEFLNNEALFRSIISHVVFDLLKKRLEQKERIGLRMDVHESQPLSLMLNIEAIKKMPSGICSTIPAMGRGKDTILVCKEEEKIKIFKMREEGLLGGAL